MPELLAPAGDWDCARAAVENGADAIYFGLEQFNARMRARNFTTASLPELMAFLHRRGVKGYVTFNTLVFENELEQARGQLRAIIAAGADAAIVQDVGVCRLIRSLSPDFPIHASTQMTITSPRGVAFARELGCQLVVLARECSLKEIAAIHGAGGAPDSGSMPLEVFVHGALCVAYSGQCLTSEALGGRSANRGECAQACRMPYELISDGKPVPLGDRRYLLSPQDLAGLDVLPDLARSGVVSLKIEGRLKSPEYVANITRVYRRALDELAAAEGHGPAASAGAGADPEPDRAEDHAAQDKYDLEMAFSRGLYTGWFRGNNNQELVHARFGKKRGVYLGQVVRAREDQVVVRLESPLKPGDGVVFDAGHPDVEEEGGRVYEARPLVPGAALPCDVALAFGAGDIDCGKIQAGDKVWKTSDPALDRRLRQTYTGEAPRFQRPVVMDVSGGIGQPMTLVVQDENGLEIRIESQVPLAQAERSPLTTGRLREQLGRLGGTPVRLDALSNRLEDGVILPVSELNRLRRKAVARLLERRERPSRWTLIEDSAGCEAGSVETAGSELPADDGKHDGLAELIVLVRTMDQLRAALEHGVRTVYCEFEDPKKYRDAVAQVRAFGTPASHGSKAEVWAAPPRIFKTGEDWILDQVLSCGADGYLARNYDHLERFGDHRWVGDFSLNVANRLAAAYFLERHGLERVTASYDLNINQLEALLRSGPAGRIEVTIHQHMPMFHMEHCVFCAFLSKGKDYRDCGRPCDRHEVRLRDRVGAEHVLKADAGCRNTVFNARAQTGAEHARRLRSLGVRWFRIEFVSESPAEAGRTIQQYQALLRGELDGASLWRALKLVSQLGVTRGTLH